MIKKCILRGLSSYCVCVTTAVFVSMILGIIGMEQTCTPDFIARVGSPVTAGFLQPLLVGLIGFAFGAGSMLFEIERWSFLRQGAAHLALTLAVWIPVELICFSPITLPAMISFGLSAAASYCITWGVQYFVWRSKVSRLNAQIHRKNQEDNP